jgi:shikimate dehydrogenase
VRLAVVGDPISHSRSPEIHTAAMSALGIDGTFDRIEVPDGEFDDVVEALRVGSLDGVNVTMPHKTRAYEVVDVRSETAERTGSVNTIVSTPQGLVGHNTDVAGASFAVESLGLPLDSPVLILGAGGAARAAVVAVADLGGTRTITVSARDPERAAATMRRTATTGHVVAWGTAVPGAIVVNATPIGMRGEQLPTGVVEASMGLVDMTYGDRPSPAIVGARDRGVPVSDGVTMLVGQARAAFVLFLGVEPPIGVMEAAARS